MREDMSHLENCPRVFSIGKAIVVAQYRAGWTKSKLRVSIGGRFGLHYAILRKWSETCPMVSRT